MTNYLIVPGLGNSGPKHWQSFFEESGENFHRIQQTEWDAPNCEDWINTIDRAVQGYSLPSVVLIGHSLGCAAIVHWAKNWNRAIKGAMLVAPSDPESANYDFPATGFTPLPLQRLSFKSIVIASEDDPWVSIERAALFAKKWGSEFISIGKAGHINVGSGHSQWEEGLAILHTLG